MSCDDAVAVAPAAAWPEEITLNGQARALELAWGGRHAVLSYRALRRSCRCSLCEQARRSTDSVLPVAADVTLLRVEPLGATALQLIFSDGHERGIYPWSYLKEMAFGPTTDGLPESLTKGWRDE
jgi:DUF971 family protein